jgi:hypothetical protein
MTRQRNLLPLAGFLLCVVAFLSYPLFFSRFPATRDVAWINWLLFAVGLGMVAVGIARPFRQPERYRRRIAGPVFGVLGVAALGLFFWMTQVYARQLPPSAGAPQVGEKAPDFTLADSQGRPVRLYSLLEQPGGGAPGISRSSWVVLIFYRGYW